MATGSSSSSAADGERRLAVIDLGSNSFRLVVFSVAASGAWRRSDEIHEMVRIGEGTGRRGELGEQPMERALHALDVYARFCRASAIEDVRPLATSAIREATNGERFLARVRELTGLPARVLSREQEAWYGYVAAVNSTTLTDGLVLDLGGGSLQLTRVEGRASTVAGSWPLGAVRMTERFLSADGPAKKGELQALRAHVRDQLADADWVHDAGPAVTGIGGAVRNLADAALRAAGLPDHGIQGFELDAGALDDLVEELAALEPGDRGAIPGIKPGRADVILAGAVVLAEVLELAGQAGVQATEAGLREGVFFADLLAEHEPPLFSSVREAAVRNLALTHHRSLAHPEHVARLALRLWDELAAAGVHDGDAAERELLWAAALLHDIGMTVDYDDHHRHSRYLILSATLGGFSPRESALLAQAVRYHRKGSPGPGEAAPLLRDGDEASLLRMSALLRVVEHLERARDQLVRDVVVRVDDDRVEVALVADGDDTVARWGAQGQAELFERAFGRELAVLG